MNKSKTTTRRGRILPPARHRPRQRGGSFGLGLRGCAAKLPAEAQREADLALLRGANDYLILHNVACIYAALSQTGGRQTPAQQDAAIALLARGRIVEEQEGRP